jgi:hypothetical protein
MLSLEHDKLKRGAARLSVLSNTILIIAKLVVSVLSGSVSILSEAIHSVAATTRRAERAVTMILGNACLCSVNCPCLSPLPVTEAETRIAAAQ